MSNTVISIEHISKSYQLGVINTGTFRGDLQRWWARQRGLPDPHLRIGEKDHGNRHGETLWALKDINFQVKQGEALGIIGRNGAGKSTLLKILSRVTATTSGMVKVKGRIASLLEVGTGFHPELTGRENIFLNGAILGMSRQEITSKFEEIVDFSGVEQFIDTPVKRYSSGMYVRLAFAVAAHLEPEILIVDEVLAVGDMDFQKKCLGKMNDVAETGRTVLFVSHNMTAITRLCQRVILLEKGTVISDGASTDVIANYLASSIGSVAEREWPDINRAPGSETAKLRSVRVYDNTGNLSAALDIRRPFRVEMEYDVFEGGRILVPNFHFYNGENLCVFITTDQDKTWKNAARPAGHYISTVYIPGNFLAEGTLTVLVALSEMNPVVVHFALAETVAFQVVDSLDGDSMRGDYGGPLPGVIRPALEWTTKYRKAKEEA
jgi:lipopolysaccharide transport system ATP-binding protein